MQDVKNRKTRRLNCSGSVVLRAGASFLHRRFQGVAQFAAGEFHCAPVGKGSLTTGHGSSGLYVSAIQAGFYGQKRFANAGKLPASMNGAGVFASLS